MSKWPYPGEEEELVKAYRSAGRAASYLPDAVSYEEADAFWEGVDDNAVDTVGWFWTGYKQGLNAQQNH